MNPEDVSGKKLKTLFETGVNRLSLGVQSFNDDDLKFLEREHTAKESMAAVESALESGFKNISLDFIIGLNGNNRNILEKNFKTAFKYKIPHISSYILEGVEDKNRKIPSGNKQIAIYNLAVEILNSFGYKRYEVSNFCTNDKRSLHNMKYWTNKIYIGTGISSSGFENGIDYVNHSNLNNYYKDIDSGIIPVKTSEKINPVKRQIVTGLRLTEGISSNLLSHKKKEVEMLLSEKILIIKGGNISVSPDKFGILNEVILHLI